MRAAGVLALSLTLGLAAANVLMPPVTAVPVEPGWPAPGGPGCQTSLLSVAICYPHSIAYASGCVTPDGTKTDNDLRFESPAAAAGFVKFDLSGVPVGSIVTNVVLSYYCYGQSGAPGTFTRRITSDPVTAPGPTLWTQATTGTQLDNNLYNSVGWMTKTFNPAGIAAVQNCLAQGWIGCGWHAWESRPYWGRAYGWNPVTGPLYRPYLTVTYSTGSPDLVIEQVSGTGFSPGSAPSGQTVPELVIRNTGTTSYPAGTITFEVRETRPVLQPARSWTVNNPLIAAGAGLPVSGMVYDPQNARPGAIEYTWSITATSTPEPAPDNQSTVLVRYYEPTVTRYHLNEAFSAGLGDWTVSGTGTPWDTTRQLPPQFPYPTMPPTVPVNHSELVVMTDSKAGNYPNSDSVEFVNTTAIDLTGRTAPFLSWCEKYNTEQDYDFCSIRVSTDNGSTWSTQRRVSGSNPSWPDWDTVRLDLAGLAGKPSLKVKFLFTSDFLVNYDGWYVDDVVLASSDMPDVQTVSVDAPSGTVNRDTTVTPRATVKNNGQVPVTFNARFRITDGYVGTATATALAPGESTQLSFTPDWTASTPGAFATSCSTELAGDPNPDNDKVTRSVFVQVVDGAVSRLLSPPLTVDSGTVLQPRARIKNLGTVVFSGVTARFTISLGGYASTRSVPNLVPGESTDVVFDNWLAPGRGAFTSRCTLTYSGDMDPSNNQQTGAGMVNVHDLVAVNVLSPSGVLAPGAKVTPSASVRNSGTLREACKAFFLINSVSPYAESISFPAGLPFPETTLTFPDWTAVGSGGLAARCSLYLSTEQNPPDNVAGLGFSIGSVDIGPSAILAPSGFYDTNAVIRPQAAVRNFGNLAVALARIVFRIDSAPGYTVYADTILRSLDAGAESVFSFTPWPAANSARAFAAFCSTSAVGDSNPANDTLSGTFELIASSPGWYTRNPMPAGTKAIKDGGWLTWDAGRARIFGSRGNKQLDFFEYRPDRDTWLALAPWLLGTENKPPFKGSAGCSDASGRVYATKGNNKLGFYLYEAGSNTWTQKRDVPLGISEKKVKGGTDLVWAWKGTAGSPYLLKGYKNEFYRYDVATDSWQTLQPAPVGINVKWDKGSWLAYDGDNRIYALKGKFMEFYYYDIAKDSWSAPLTPMPIPGSGGTKKAKAGSCGTWLNGCVFAFKGGNTQEFWRYAPEANAWAEKETIPRGITRKKVNTGADLVTVNASLYATKGNKSNELWKYVPSGLIPVRPGRDGVALASLPALNSALIVSPNPLRSGFVTISLARPLDPLDPHALSLSLFDASGRLVHSSMVRRPPSVLDLRSMPAGVYLLKVSGDGLTSTAKLAVQR